MSFKKIIMLVTLVIFSFGTTHANELSLGVLGGKSYFTDLDEVCSSFCIVDDRDTAVGINLGYSLNQIWGLELGYIDFGTSTLESIVFGENFLVTKINAGIDASVIYITGTVTGNVSDHFSITGRFGVGSLDLEGRSSIIIIEDSSEELFAGVSLDYNFTDSFSAGIRLDRVSDLSATSVALKVKF